jgi:hypothetical protein
MLDRTHLHLLLSHDYTNILIVQIFL